jgi:hypothetical protein
MSLFVFSILAVCINTLLQSIPRGHVVDVISPLITAVALAAPRKTAFAWIAVMGLLWSAFVSLSFVAVILVWSVVVWSIGLIARDLAWEHKPVGATIAVLVSFSWQCSLLIIDCCSGHAPSVDMYSLGTLFIRPITSGVLFIVLCDVLIHAANPRLVLPGR